MPDPYDECSFTLLQSPKGSGAIWERALLERHTVRCPGRLVTAGEISRDQGRYIICFSYYDFPTLLGIRPDRAIYIYSSSEAFNEEMMFDHTRTRNWIDYFGMECYGALGKERGYRIHASGHIHGPGLIELVTTINPRVLLPVHTEDPDFFKQHLGGLVRLVFPQMGERLNLGALL